MSPQLATIVYVAGILGLFFLDRDARVRTSKALWIPVAWILVNGSRPVSTWFQSGPTIAQTGLGTEGSPVDATIYGILIALAVVVLSRRSRRVGKFLRGNLPILLFFAYCAVSLIWSDYPFVAFKRWIKAVGDLAMILIVLTDIDPLAATKRLYARGAFVLLPLSVLLIKYYPDLGRSYNPWTWIPMYSGVTTYKNLLGMICLVFGLGSLWSFLDAYEQRKMPHRIRHLAAHGVVIAMAVWLFISADSMTSLSCFVMAGAVMAASTSRWVEKRTGLVHLMIAAVVALSLAALFLDTGGTLVSSLGRNVTLTGRKDIWKAVLSIHINPLLGAGFESFWVGSRLQRVWDMTAQGIQEAHNGYLEVYLNLGWVGLALLAGLIVTGYRNALAVFRRDPHAGRLRIGFFTAALLYSLTEAGFRMMGSIWTAFLLAILAVPPGLLLRRERPRRSALGAAPAALAVESPNAVQECF
jgi:exopolysaccharide production protein ExoQ